jgi:hypothetical protein
MTPLEALIALVNAVEQFTNATTQVWPELAQAKQIIAEQSKQLTED